MTPRPRSLPWRSAGVLLLAASTVAASTLAASSDTRTSGRPSRGAPAAAFADAGAGAGAGATSAATGRPRQLERLDRGVVSVHSPAGNLVSWRLLGTDPSRTAFNVYRGSTRLTAHPVTGSTSYLDRSGSAAQKYTVRAVVDGVEQAGSGSLALPDGYLSVPLQVPAGGTTPDKVTYTYSANDTGVGDLDGDGRYELVVKWDPSNSHDNAQNGYTGNVYLDGYRLDGTRLWRIDLGRNIRAGAHYTQFQVYDFDGDGRAEVAVKTADGTVDGTGRMIGSASADHRGKDGRVLSGPEYLTMFNGVTGRAMATVGYEPARGRVTSWGDKYGNRVDRFLAATAYLDGTRPSLVMARGYYARTAVVAWNWRGGAWQRVWTFDTATAGKAYEGQGNHSLAVADLDRDGRDEIVHGAMALDHNGTVLWSTGNGHGDALHVGDLDPSRAGVEVFKVDEDKSRPAAWMADGATGRILWKNDPCACDNGRGVSGDIYAGSPGAESWSAGVGGLFSASGKSVGRKPSSANFLVYWDGDPVRELLDRTHIDKYGPNGDTRLLTASGVSSNNGTKATPALAADLFGDWREEVVWRTTDSTALRIYSTPTPTTLRLYTLMHDSQYRVAVAWQNTAYNQPPHTGYVIGDGMAAPPAPAMYVP